MELAGLACAQTVARTYPAASYKRVLVIIGPGNQVSKAASAVRRAQIDITARRKSVTES